MIIALEAHHEERNHHRRYEVAVGQDLLRDWTVVIRFGRIGHTLQQVQFAASRPEVARAVVAERLRRRLSAHRRIGCPYVLRELFVREGVSTLEWIPVDVLNSLVNPGFAPVMVE